MTLHDAAQRGDLDAIRSLLAAGEPVDARDERGRTPLLRAAARGSLEAVQLLREAGADLQARDGRGYTALHWAAEGNRPDMIGVLLDAGFDIEERAVFGNTPLIAAALLGSTEAVAALVAKGAAVNATTWDGKTAFHFATGRLGKEVRKILGAASAGAPKPKAPTPAELLWRAAEAGDSTKVRELLAAGVSANTSLCYGQSPLSRAVAFGHVDTVRLLLDAGADPKIRDAEGNTLLLEAVFSGNAELVRLILQQGVDVNAADLEGGTPLMAAAHEGHIEIAQLLLAAGADRNARGNFLDKKDRTPLQLAGQLEDRKVRKAMKDLLAGSGAAAADPAEHSLQEVENFASTAKQPAFQEMLTLLGEVCKAAPKRWTRCKGTYRCARINLAHVEARYAGDDKLKEALSAADREERIVLLIERLQADVRSAGFHLIRADAAASPAAVPLVLIPTADKYAVLAALGTNGANYGHDTQAISAWLRAMEADNPFVLTACGEDFVAGTFVNPVAGADSLAARMCQFCPDLIDGDVVENPAQVAAQLEQANGFFFWWD